jgi:hypothetical protein
MQSDGIAVEYQWAKRTHLTKLKSLPFELWVA